MTETEFWKLIDKSRRKSKAVGQLQIELLTEWLSEKSEEDIIDFYTYQLKFRNIAHTSELWCVVWVSMSGGSDDGFDYFKAWLIAQGKETYTQALQNPDSLVDILVDAKRRDEPTQFEEFMYVASEAYEQLTGEYLEEYQGSYTSKIEISEYVSLTLDWAGTEEKMKAICPQIYATFRKELLKK